MIALPRVAQPRQNHRGEFVGPTRQPPNRRLLPLIQRFEIGLEVVAVQIGAAEHDHALHLVFVHQRHQQLQLRALLRFAFVLRVERNAGEWRRAMHAVGERRVVDIVELLLRGVGDVDEEIDLLNGGGNVVATLQIHPHRIATDFIGQMAD